MYQFDPSPEYVRAAAACKRLHENDAIGYAGCMESIGILNAPVANEIPSPHWTVDVIDSYPRTKLWLLLLILVGIVEYGRRK
jgi:hypothetical protein